MKRIFKFIFLSIVFAFMVTQMGCSPSSSLTFTPVSPPLPNGWTGGALWGVWGCASAVYAVGSASNNTTTVPLIDQYGGSGWTSSILSLPSGWTGGELQGVWGSSCSDVYAVGGAVGAIGGPLIYHYNGSGWTSSTPSLPSGWTGGGLHGVWGSSSSDVYAVGGGGGTILSPLIYHYNGSTWTSSTPSLPSGWTTDQLMGVWGSSSSDIYAVAEGNNGTTAVPLIYHYNGSTWTSSTLSLPSGWEFGTPKGVWGSSSSDVYFVGGGNNQTTGAPLLYHYNGSGWTSSSLSLPGGWTNGGLNGVWGFRLNSI